MPTDEEIRDLCAKVLESNGAEFETAIHDLQSAIRSRLADLSNKAFASLLILPRASSAQHEPATSKTKTTKTKTAAAGVDDEPDQAS